MSKHKSKTKKHKHESRHHHHHHRRSRDKNVICLIVDEWNAADEKPETSNVVPRFDRFIRENTDASFTLVSEGDEDVSTGDTDTLFK